MTSVNTRRGFLRSAIAATVVTAGVASSVENKRKRQNRAFWQQLTATNWGYTAAGIQAYHDTTGDTGRGRNILVIDGGFDTDHQLYSPAWHEDFIPYQVNISDVVGGEAADDVINDPVGHGTSVVGTVWQAAPNASFYLAPSIQQGQGTVTKLENMARILRAAKRREETFDVIVTSLGTNTQAQGIGPDWLEFSRWILKQCQHIPVNVSTNQDLKGTQVCRRYQEQQDLWGRITSITDAGSIFVAAAGNSDPDQDNQIELTYPAFPSTVTAAISVASTDHGTIADDWSPRRTWNNKPDIAAPGQGITTVAHSSETTQLDDSEVEGVAVKSGSSLAAPLVAGAAALLMQYGDEQTVKDELRRNTADIDSPIAGHGRLSLEAAYRAIRPTDTEDNLITDKFESGAYDDGRPVTWQVKSPGEYITVQSTTVKTGRNALEAKSEGSQNNAVLYRTPEKATVKEGDIYSAWLRAGGRVPRVDYTIGTEIKSQPAHGMRAAIIGDHNNIRVASIDETGSTLDMLRLTPASPETWYYFEMEPVPSSAELIGRIYDSSRNLLGQKTLSTTGENRLEYTTLFVPTPFGSSSIGWFDDVTVRK